MDSHSSPLWSRWVRFERWMLSTPEKLETIEKWEKRHSTNPTGQRVEAYLTLDELPVKGSAK